NGITGEIADDGLGSLGVVLCVPRCGGWVDLVFTDVCASCSVSQEPKGGLIPEVAEECRVEADVSSFFGVALMTMELRM
ncbi:hypothetical protein Dimus_002849, partial [Dionaea muscipula]